MLQPSAKIPIECSNMFKNPAKTSNKKPRIHTYHLKHHQSVQILKITSIIGLSGYCKISKKNTVNTSHNVKHVFFGGLAYIWCKFRAMPTIWMKHILKYIFWSGEANNKNPWVWNGHRQLIVGEIHLFSCLKIHMLLVKSESSCFRNPLLSRLNTVYHHYSHNQLSWRILDALRLFSKL